MDEKMMTTRIITQPAPESEPSDAQQQATTGDVNRLSVPSHRQAAQNPSRTEEMTGSTPAVTNQSMIANVRAKIAELNSRHDQERATLLCPSRDSILARKKELEETNSKVESELKEIEEMLEEIDRAEGTSNPSTQSETKDPTAAQRVKREGAILYRKLGEDAGKWVSAQELGAYSIIPVKDALENWINEKTVKVTGERAQTMYGINVTSTSPKRVGRKGVIRTKRCRGAHLSASPCGVEACSQKEVELTEVKSPWKTILKNLIQLYGGVHLPTFRRDAQRQHRPRLRSCWHRSHLGMTSRSWSHVRKAQKKCCESGTGHS